jgi:hypothetical protein
MCLSRPKMPKAPDPVAPPPMYVPEGTDEQVVRSRDRQRLRARAAYGRQSTIVGSAIGPVAPTSQQKQLTGA